MPECCVNASLFLIAELRPANFSDAFLVSKIVSFSTAENPRARAPRPRSVCRQTLEKLDQNNCLKWLKAANKGFKRCHKVLVCRSVLRCSNLQFLFSTEDDPVHFARTLLTVTLKQIHHFKCKRSEIAAAITMSTDCNLQISLSMNCFCVYFWTNPSVF